MNTSGYKWAILQDDRGRGSDSQPDGLVNEWIARGEFVSLFESPKTLLNLQIRETPELPWDDLSEWKSPLEFGGKPDDGIDDTAAIQAAIDSGAKTVYLPNGTWNLNGTVELRGKVHRFLGTEAAVQGDGAIAILDGTSPTVIVERLEAGSIDILHESDRTLVLSSLIIDRYSSTGGDGGDVFIEDVSGGPWTFTRQNVWARQINPETGANPRIKNDGGSLWIYGYKTEDEGTLIETTNGGKTELIGGLILNGSFGDIPAFINDESSLSYAQVGFLTFGNGSVPVGIRETRGGVTRTTEGLPEYYTGYDESTLQSYAESENWWQSLLGFLGIR